MAHLRNIQQGTPASATHTQGTSGAPAGVRTSRAAAARSFARASELWPDGTRCPVRDVLDRIGDTWSLLVVVRLGAAPLRFRELQRQVGSISQRMLTVTLRALERDGLVVRRVLDGAPLGVQYSLSALGVSLVPAIAALADWALANDAGIRASRERFDARAAPAVGVTQHRLTPKASGHQPPLLVAG